MKTNRPRVIYERCVRLGWTETIRECGWMAKNKIVVCSQAFARDAGVVTFKGRLVRLAWLLF